MKPLTGLTVLDLTRLLPGAVATQYLAAHGAEVIKIEQPGEGDYARTMNPPLFARTNAGKKSVVIDLKQESGKAALLRLAAKADVLIEGFRPGVMARLGLGYDDVAAVNGRIIYVSLSGYGQTGENAGLAGHDINYIAMGGLLGMNLPVIPRVLIGDLVGGSMQSVIGILMALQQRSVTGRGRYVDVSMTEGVRSLMTAGPGGDMLTGRYGCYNVYECADGRSVAVGALEPKFWIVLCKRLGCEDLIPLQFDGARQDEVKVRVGSLFRSKAAEEWFAQLRDADCCVTPVRTVSEGGAGTPASLARAPELGEHNDEILTGASPPIPSGAA